MAATPVIIIAGLLQATRCCLHKTAVILQGMTDCRWQRSNRMLVSAPARLIDGLE
jgi:hypothetical protein